MLAINNTNFFVVDIETTGSKSRTDRITEIAAVHLRNGRIEREFSSLIKVRQPIPYYIQKMTGITHDLLRNAPEEFDVLEDFAKFLDVENSVFVAHNASFDWNFVLNSIKRADIQFEEMPVLCTVKLARKLLPKGQKVNLGDLSKYFEVPVTMRHRALGDAKATALSLVQLLDIVQREHTVTDIDSLMNFQKKSKRNFKVNGEIKTKLEKDLKKLPKSPGVFYFLNDSNEVIYFDKTKNLKFKVNSFFEEGNVISKKINDMISNIDRMEWAEFPTTLHASILDLKHQLNGIPKYNTQLNHIIPNEICNDNLLFIQPSSYYGKTFNFYVIKDGVFKKHLEYGRKTDIHKLLDSLESAYSEEKLFPEADELQHKAAVSKWISNHKDTGTLIKLNGTVKAHLTEIQRVLQSESFESPVSEVY